MARNPDDQRLQQMYEAVHRYPGERPGFFARLLGWSRSDVTRRLPALEERGLFLSEDERGGLWPFKHRRP
jgi:DNA-binding MarR family transcriptional regulator